MTEDELKWVTNAERYGGSFVQAFALACRRADDQNFVILRPALGQFMNKYPRYSQDWTGGREW